MVNIDDLRYPPEFLLRHSDEARNRYACNNECPYFKDLTSLDRRIYLTGDYIDWALGRIPDYNADLCGDGSGEPR